MTWADDRGVMPTSQTIDRDAGAGPPRCCVTRLVAADGLVWWGGQPAEILGRVRAALPALASVGDADLYLCGGCRETLWREKLVTREEIARGLGLSETLIAKAWRHDEQFWQRGPDSAPAEVLAQPWWPAYRAVMLAAMTDEAKRRTLDSDLKRVLREGGAG